MEAKEYKKKIEHLKTRIKGIITLNKFNNEEREKAFEDCLEMIKNEGL